MFEEKAILRNARDEYSDRLILHEKPYGEVNYSQIETRIIDRLINVTLGTEEIIDHGHNLIVVNFGKTVASLLKINPTYGQGITFMAVGDGEGVSWDSLTVAQRQAKSTFALTQLYNEIGRTAVTGTNWIDNSNLVSVTPTNRIEVIVTLTVPIVGSLREFGLFAANATGAANSGFMLNHKAHTKIDFNLDSAFTQVLIRSIRLTL